MANAVYIHIEGDDAAEALKQLKVLAAGLGMHDLDNPAMPETAGAPIPANTGAVEEKPKRGRPAKDEKKEEAVKHEPPANTAPSTTQDLQKLVPSVIAKIGREKFVALLGEFKAAKVREIAEADVPAFTAKVQAILAE